MKVFLVIFGASLLVGIPMWFIDNNMEGLLAFLGLGIATATVVTFHIYFIMEDKDKR